MHTRDDVALLRRLLEMSEDRMTNHELIRIEALADHLDWELDCEEMGVSVPTDDEIANMARPGR